MTAGRPAALVYDPIRTIEWAYDVDRARLAARGVELIVPDGAGEVAALLPEADVVIVSDTLPANRIPELRRCVGILAYKVGTDGIDVAAAAAAGIRVANVPGYCSDEVSDHALTLLLALARRLVPVAAAAARGDWDVWGRPDVRAIRRLSTLTVGIVGAGRIGGRVARRVLGIGMRALAFDPYLDASPVPGLALVPFERLLAESDALVLCAPLTAESRRLVDGRAIARMRPGVLLVNVARGDLVDEAALADGLRSGQVGAAALDVRATEPPDPASDPLRGLPNLVLTPHIAATSVDSFADLHEMAAQVVITLLEEAGRLPRADGR